MEWSSWEITDCSATCGSGTLTKTRECSGDNPQEGECLLTDSNESGTEELLTLSCNPESCPGKQYCILYLDFDIK